MRAAHMFPGGQAGLVVRGASETACLFRGVSVPPRLVWRDRADCPTAYPFRRVGPPRWTRGGSRRGTSVPWRICSAENGDRRTRRTCSAAYLFRQGRGPGRPRRLCGGTCVPGASVPPNRDEGTTDIGRCGTSVPRHVCSHRDERTHCRKEGARRVCSAESAPQDGGRRVPGRRTRSAAHLFLQWPPPLARGDLVLRDASCACPQDDAADWEGKAGGDG
jgi:hypothetical protein